MVLAPGVSTEALLHMIARDWELFTKRNLWELPKEASKTSTDVSSQALTLTLNPNSESTLQDFPRAIMEVAEACLPADTIGSAQPEEVASLLKRLHPQLWEPGLHDFSTIPSNGLPPPLPAPLPPSPPTTAPSTRGSNAVVWSLDDPFGEKKIAATELSSENTVESFLEKNSLGRFVVPFRAAGIESMSRLLELDLEQVEEIVEEAGVGEDEVMRMLHYMERLKTEPGKKEEAKPKVMGSRKAMERMEQGRGASGIGMPPVAPTTWTVDRMREELKAKRALLSEYLCGEHRDLLSWREFKAGLGRCRLQPMPVETELWSLFSSFGLESDGRVSVKAILSQLDAGESNRNVDVSVPGVLPALASFRSGRPSTTSHRAHRPVRGPHEAPSSSMEKLKVFNPSLNPRYSPRVYTGLIPYFRLLSCEFSALLFRR